MFGFLSGVANTVEPEFYDHPFRQAKVVVNVRCSLKTGKLCHVVAAIFACASCGKCENLSKMCIIMIEQANPNFIDDYFIQLRITQEFA